MSRTSLHFISQRLVVCALAGLFIAAVAPRAFSGEPNETVRSITVKFADLDLSKAAGADALYRRIRTAASIVCDSASDNLYRWRGREYKKCFNTAVANAVDKVNNPILTAMHRAKSKGTNLS